MRTYSPKPPPRFVPSTAAAFVFALVGHLLLSGCNSHEKPANELLTNGDFNRGTQPWQSANTINAPGVFSVWRPGAGREKTAAVEITVSGPVGTAIPSWTCELPDAPRGRSILVSGFVRGVGVAGSPGIEARAWSPGHETVLAGVNTEDTQAPAGNFEWTPLRAVFDIPNAAASIDLRIFFRGPGTVWFDDLSARIIPEHVDATPEGR